MSKKEYLSRLTLFSLAAYSLAEVFPDMAVVSAGCLSILPLVLLLFGDT